MQLLEDSTKVVENVALGMLMPEARFLDKTLLDFLIYLGW
ncbi:hypothetical protein AND4_04523 [Vibrio sp. AND4]|nr:hypothetical protein AND4_04523 [Vibrio sp. AND4]